MLRDVEQVGERLRVSALVRARRGELGWSLQRVADAVGCAKSYLSEVENENRLPEEAMLRKIERAMKMTRGVLVEAGRWQRGLAAGGETLEAELARLRASDAERRRLEELLGKGVERGSEGAREGEPSAQASGVSAQHAEGTAARRRAGTKGGGDAMAGGGSNVRTYVVADVRRELPREVPLINKVAAGYPTAFTDLGYPARVADEYVRVPTAGDLDDPDVFAARVVGDSMEPEYREGDVIVFSPGRAVKSGDDCFVRLGEGGETTFKRVYFEGTEARRHRGTEGEAEEVRSQRSVVGGEAEGAGAMIRLQPLNNAYPAKVVRREEVAGLYAAVTWIRKLGGGGR